MPAERPRANLLIVDDEEGPRQSLRIVFKNDYNVFVASNGSEALKIAHDERIDVAVCDILMSGMSGVEVLKGLKDIDRDIEVVMLTAYETLETARQALRYGASDYLNKPFDIPTMRAAVAKAADKRFSAKVFEQTNTQLERLHDQVKDQRMKEEIERTKGEIYASVLHDINSPLTVISGFIELINQSMRNAATVEGEQLENLKGDLQHLTGEVSRCFEISRRYLRFLNGESAQNMACDLKQILQDLRDLLRKHPSTNGHKLDVHLLERSVGVAINGTDLLQVLLNLTINALQSSAESHSVEVGSTLLQQGIDASAFDDSEEQRFVGREGFNSNQPLVVITVQDNGPGVPANLLAKMFEEQFTTKAPNHGTGLGLSIVNRLVKNADGAIRVQTRVGKGTSFAVVLPLSPLTV
jgi:signal transduction histidine kinase